MLAADLTKPLVVPVNKVLIIYFNEILEEKLWLPKESSSSDSNLSSESISLRVNALPLVNRTCHS